MKLPVRFEKKHHVIVDADGYGVCHPLDEHAGEVISRVINNHNQLVASLQRAIFLHGNTEDWAVIALAAISASGKI